MALKSGIYAILDIDRLAAAAAVDEDDDVRSQDAEINHVLAYARAAVFADACALQLRAKQVPATSLFLRRLYAAVLDEVGHSVAVVMNDHLAAAEAFAGREGVGLHLGQDDLSPVTARHHLAAALLGWSTHGADQVAAAQGMPLDYIGFGPVRSTASKTAVEPTTGFDALSAACAASAIPVVAIGGLGPDDVAAVRAAGAQAMAVIGGWLGPQDAPWSPSRAADALAAMVATWGVGVDR